jgi:hypothetical protein
MIYFRSKSVVQHFFKKLVIAIALVIAVSCSGKKNITESGIKPYPYTINVEEGLKNKVQFRLSDVADSIKYVVLSKNKEVLIEDVFRLKMEGNDIYFTSGYSFMHFDISGKFLNSFGREGRGPEEYIRGSLLSTTPTNDSILILRSSDYMIFSPAGKYIGTRKIPHSRNLIGFTNIADSIFLFTFFFHGAFMKDEIYNSLNSIAGIYKQDGSPIQVIEHPLRNARFSSDEIKQIISQPPTHTFFDGRIILSLESDTVYEISKKEIVPGFIFHWGSVPHQSTLEEKFIRSKRPDHLMSHSTLFETTFNAFLWMSRTNESYIFGYDKRNGETMSMSLQSEDDEFKNDIDGGADFFPFWTNREGDIWIASDDAINFRKKNSSEALEKTKAINPQKTEELRKLVEELKDDDNPVLTIVYLKKQRAGS